MSIKLSLCAAALAVPLLAVAAGPTAAHGDGDFGLGAEFGFGSPHYGMYPYGPYYDPYDDRGLAVGVDADDVVVDVEADVEMVEPAAAEPAPCVKTNVRNLRNACPF